MIERSYGRGIKEVITHPDIYPRLTDDYSPKYEDWKPIAGRIYLVGWDGEVPYGVTSFPQKSTILYGAHIQVIPEYRKSHAVSFAKDCVQWLWGNTQAKKIVAEVPDIYPDVVGFAKKVGFKEEGVNTKSLMKGGELHNQIYLGLEYE